VRRAARTDANQSEIVKALRKVGCSVQVISQVGDGCTDLMVGYRHRTIAMEVKLPKEKLNKVQRAWHEAWRGEACVVRSVDEALLVLGIST
jgi:hypothetical protein